MSETEIKVPNIGDFKDVEVIEVLVSEGQILQKNDPIITIESDKSSVEIPSNFEGKIKSLKTKIGDKISEGDLILILEETSATKENTEEKPNIEKEFKKIKVIKPETEQTSINQVKNLSNEISSASPKARKFARELGVDITQVVGSEKDGMEVERYNLLNPDKEQKTSFVEKCLGKTEGPIMAASDYMRMNSDQIRPYTNKSFYSLGTDGFGRSDTRKNLRKFFEVDKEHLVAYSLSILAKEQLIASKYANEAIKKYKIDGEKPMPTKL